MERSGMIQKLRNEEKNKKDDTGKVLIGIEKHHILPRFDGGTDDPSNLVLVSIKEHVIAHWLRWRVLEKPQGGGRRTTLSTLLFYFVLATPKKLSHKEI